MTASKWEGCTVVCMASGPSLNRSDVERVKAWRDAADHRRAVVTNTTFKLAPWADVLYAMDAAWWRMYHHEVAKVFKGERYTTARNSAPGAQRIINNLGGNSGAGAIGLAEYFGARRMILLGFDCQYTGGKRHWHGDHPDGLGNCVSLPNFPRHFDQLARRLKHCEIINASRATAIEEWPTMPLEQALQKFTPERSRAIG